MEAIALRSEPQIFKIYFIIFFLPSCNFTPSFNKQIPRVLRLSGLFKIIHQVRGIVGCFSQKGGIHLLTTSEVFIQFSFVKCILGLYWKYLLKIRSGLSQDLDRLSEDFRFDISLERVDREHFLSLNAFVTSFDDSGNMLHELWHFIAFFFHVLDSLCA